MESINTNYWQITEFASKITEGMESATVHYNTVAKWFNALETKRIHYVNRANGEKIYDELDLEIGRFIYKKREEKWRLDIIYEAVPTYIEPRPFPVEDSKDLTEVFDMTKLEESLVKKMEEEMLNNFRTLKTSLEDQLETLAAGKLSQMLPAPKKPEEVRAERFDQALLQMRVGLKLEEEALVEWRKQPEEIRMRKAGFFRKEENYEERERFIRNYKATHMERALRSELGFETN